MAARLSFGVLRPGSHRGVVACPVVCLVGRPRRRGWEAGIRLGCAEPVGHLGVWRSGRGTLPLYPGHEAPLEAPVRTADRPQSILETAGDTTRPTGAPAPAAALRRGGRLPQRPLDLSHRGGLRRG